MKKLLLIVLFAGSFAASASLQSISNATWDIYSSSNVLTNRVYFGTDTVFYSSNLTSFYPIATYTLNGNSITFVDIPDAPKACSGNDPGKYIYSVENDNLTFSLISDICTIRAEEKTKSRFVRNSSNIQIYSSEPTVVVYPNPSIDGIYYLRISNNNSGFDRLSVYTSGSQLILEEKIPAEGLPEYTLNLTDFPQGIYLLTLHGQNGSRIIKLLRSK